MRSHSLSKIKKLQLQCDKEFSKLIRDKNICEHCNKTGNFDTAHFISRTNLTLRWDILNVIHLCRDCHMYFHANPKVFEKWFYGTFPEREEYIGRAKNIILKRGESDYMDLLKAIKARDFWKLLLSNWE